MAAVEPVIGQVGYISVHVKALNEESSPQFQYTVSGGPSSIAPFFLTDQPSTQKCSDLGGSHDPGGKGELWIITGAKANTGANGLLWYRKMGQEAWTPTGDSAAAVDGAGPGQCVYTTAHGYVVAYNNGVRDTLYIPANHSGHRAMDVGNNASLTYGQGATFVADDEGDLLAYSGVYANRSDHWLNATLANTAIPHGIAHLDVNINNNNVLFSVATGRVYQLTSVGGVTALGSAPSYLPMNTDVAYDDKGGIYCIAKNLASGGDGVCVWTGSTWKGDSTSRNIEHITGGSVNEVWGINGLPTDPNCKAEIFARSTDSTHFWYDNEWINTGGGNAILIPVSPGTYTVTGAGAADWACQGITVYDPTHNSSASVETNSATLNVSAGEVVTADFRNGLVQPANIPQVCQYAIQQDFGTGATAYGAPLTGLTDYHYLGVAFPEDGYYTLSKLSGKAWGNATLVDHTNGKGYFMIVNASYGKDEFYRERVTGLVPGLHYTLSAYIANLSPAEALKPNVLFGISDATTGALLGSLSTGEINNTAWQQYSFTFVATTTAADILLSNNAIGGAGNDLALDDIAFAPIPDPISPISTLGSDTLCVGSPLVLSDTAGNGVWSSLDPSLASVDNTGRVTSLGTGQARIRFSVTNRIGCISADTVRVTILPHVAASDIHISLPSICTGDSVVVHTTDPTLNAARFSWYADSAMTRLLDTGATFATPPLDVSTTYYVTAAGSNACANLPGQAAKTLVTVNAYPVVPALTGASSLCAGAGTTLRDATPGGTWNISPDSIATVDSAGQVTGKQSGQAQVTYQVSNAGCTTDTTLTLSVWPLPLVDSIAGTHPVCQGDTLRVQDSVRGGVWSTADQGIAQVDANGAVSALAAGTTSVLYTVYGQNGCAASTSTPVTVQGPPPVPSVTGSSPNVCGGRIAQLKAEPGAAFLYRWYADGNLLPGDSTDTVSVNQAGSYTAVALSEAGCASITGPPLEVTARCEVLSLSDLSIVKQVSPGPYSVQKPVTYTLTIVNRGPGQATDILVTDTLSPSLGDPTNYSGPLPFYNGANRALYWSIPALAPMDSITLTFDVPIEALNIIPNTAQVTSAVSDPDTTNNHSTVTIWQDGALFIPNAVSPNGDGKNDRFLIVGLDKYPGSSLNVYNRWGNEVYHSDNYANDWDGHELGDGTYYYILLLNTPHGKTAYKGWVEILHK